DSILGRNNLPALGRAHADQLWRAFRRGHGFALARWRERKRRIAYRRHRYRGARPPLRQLHAKLPEPDSARGESDLSHCRNDRTVSVRPNLRRLVESERLIRRKGRRRALRRTLPTRNRRDVARFIADHVARDYQRFNFWWHICLVFSI